SAHWSPLLPASMLHSCTLVPLSYPLLFSNAPPTPVLYPLSLHDALPISAAGVPTASSPPGVCNNAVVFAVSEVDGTVLGTLTAPASAVLSASVASTPASIALF